MVLNQEVVGVARDAAVAGEVYGVVDLFGATVAVQLRQAPRPPLDEENAPAL